MLMFGETDQWWYMLHFLIHVSSDAMMNNIGILGQMVRHVSELLEKYVKRRDWYHNYSYVIYILHEHTKEH